MTRKITPRDKDNNNNKDAGAREELRILLHRLEQKYPTKARIAEALGLKYISIAHYYDGRSLPNFGTTIKMLRLLNLYDGEVRHG